MSLDYEVRTLCSGDADLLSQLLDCFGEAFDDPDTYTGKRPNPRYLDDLLSGESFIAIAALADSDVIGGLAAYDLKKFERERSEIYIYDLAVAEPYRRQGIATALVERLKPVARKRGAWVIYVQADRIDEPAIQLYTKLGVREDVLHFDIPIVGCESATP